MRGRKPKPTAVKRIAGNPGRRKLNDQEPRFALGIPSPPDHLDRAAQMEWKRVAGELAAQGVLAHVDRAALATYCVYYSRWKLAEEKLVETGSLVFRSKDGGTYQNPWLAISNRAAEAMVKVASEFGMTPASRSRIKADPAGGADDLTEMLFASASARGNETT